MHESINDLHNLYQQDCARRKTKTIKELNRIYHKYIAGPLGQKKLNKVVRGDIAKLHFSLSETAPAQANKVLTLLRSMFNLAITLSLVESNPATHIAKNKENKRKLYLTSEQLIQVKEQLDLLYKNKRYQESVDFIWLLLLTGARCGEIAKAKWTDLQGNMLVLSEHKTDQYGEERVIHLSERALDIINRRAQEGERIFNIQAPRRAWDKIRKTLGIEEFRLHDLRHTFASFSLQKLPLAQVGHLLGHKDQKTTARYAHIHKDKAIESAALVSEHIEALLQPTEFRNQI